MNGPIAVIMASLLLMLIMAIYACYRIGGIVRDTGDFWTCYYLLVPNWFTKEQFDQWMDQPLVADDMAITRKEAFNQSPEYAELMIKTISEVLTSPAPYEVYEIVTV